MAYDFTTLSPDDFELLVADLFSREFGAPLEIFKAGKDRGIDLRHSRTLPGQKNAILQCKRYAPHKCAELLRGVKLEVPKIEKLKPERYLLVTSVSLSDHNKQAVLQALEPWCHGTGDIYSATEVNALLRRYPDVERAHFKLWMSSTAVLERIVNARIFGVTEATVEAAKEQMSRLVVHDGFRRALEHLGTEHHVLIVGNPGIGKTTVARMLLCHYLQEGFEPVVIVGDIGDVWSAMQGSKGGERKLVVLYDDFLGQLKFESMRFGKNEELSLGEFLNKVRRTDHLRFILTTREYILADAQRVHGAFQAQAETLTKCTITLSDYTPLHRAQILFNHLYFSDLPDSRLQKLVERRVYRKIIEHDHFSPRIVEGISQYANSRALTDEEYVAYVEREFDDPRSVWDHPFRHQIGPTAREVLIALWSLRGRVDLAVLKSAALHLKRRPSAEDASLEWTEALRALDGNFLKTGRYPLHFRDGHVLLADFHNPSVAEYVKQFVISEPAWLEQLAAAIVSFAQVDHLLDVATETRKGPARKMSDAFWYHLDKTARQREFEPTGHLGNYLRGERVFTQEWDDTSAPTRSRRMLSRLMIAQNLPPDAPSHQELRRRLTSDDGWVHLLEDAATDTAVPYGVATLLEWIHQDSAWPQADRIAVGVAFRSYMLHLLQSEDHLEPISVESLLQLAKSMALFDPPLTLTERDALAAAARHAVDTGLDEIDDYGMLQAEADSVVELGALCGVNMDSQKEWLLEAAEEHAERRRGWDDDERDRYRSESAAPVDVDELFAGLLNR